MVQPKLKLSIRRYLDYSTRIVNRYRSGGHPLDRTVVLTGSPRSGTSWLFEMLLRVIPGVQGIWEPLRISKYRVIKNMEDPLRPYLDPESPEYQWKPFFYDLLTGRNAQFSTLPDFRLWIQQLWKSPRILLIKFVRANRMLPWLCTHFTLKGALVIIRHPCAVVASQLKHNAWYSKKLEGDQRYPLITRAFLDELPFVRELLDKDLTPEQKLAITWGFDYYIPLKYRSKVYYDLIAYESMVRNGPAELERVARKLNLTPPSEMNETFFRNPSSTTSGDSHVVTQEDPLTTWQKRLNKSQINDILEIADRFGLGFYSDALEPDYDHIQIQASRVK